MTMVDTYSAECGDCGNIELLKFSLRSFNTFTRIPDLDFSTDCEKCGSENIVAISSDDAIEKKLQRLKDKHTGSRPKEFSSDNNNLVKRKGD